METALWGAATRSRIGHFAGLYGYGPGDSASDRRDCYEALLDCRETYQEQVSRAGWRCSAQLRCERETAALRHFRGSMDSDCRWRRRRGARGSLRREVYLVRSFVYPE